MELAGFAEPLAVGAAEALAVGFAVRASAASLAACST
jgi:hypothetical protein